jgi:hypothetical protein
LSYSHRQWAITLPLSDRNILAPIARFALSSYPNMRDGSRPIKRQSGLGALISHQRSNTPRNSNTNSRQPSGEHSRASSTHPALDVLSPALPWVGDAEYDSLTSGSRDPHVDIQRASGSQPMVVPTVSGSLVGQAPSVIVTASDTAGPSRSHKGIPTTFDSQPSHHRPTVYAPHGLGPEMDQLGFWEVFRGEDAVVE